MNLILLTKDDFIGDDLYAFDDHRAEHVVGVLKSVEGDTLQAGIVDGACGGAVVEEICDGRVVLRCSWHKDAAGETGSAVNVVCALPRPGTLKKVLHSAGAMGLGRVDLIRARRVKDRFFKSSVLEGENLKGYLLEGMSQGKFTRLPVVTVHESFRQFIDSTAEMAGVKLLADLDTQDRLTDIAIEKNTDVTIAIGPEGGWVPFEVDYMINRGFVPFNMGPWTLRVENAMVAAISQVHLCR